MAREVPVDGGYGSVGHPACGCCWATCHAGIFAGLRDLPHPRAHRRQVKRAPASRCRRLRATLRLAPRLRYRMLEGGESMTIHEFLREAHVPYSVVPHRLAFTAKEEAAAAQVPGRDWAKVVVCL